MLSAMVCLRRLIVPVVHPDMCGVIATFGNSWNGNFEGRMLKLALFAIQDGVATRVNEVPGAEAAQGVVFTQDSKTILVQFDVERALAVYAIRDGKLVDSGARIKLAAGPVSNRSMPR
jgi:hypothetical protein